jgi:HEAT repeat protein
MRHTLALMIGAAMPLLAGAQVPPTPPRAPSAPRVAPEPRPPREPREPRFDFDFDFNFDPRFDIKIDKEAIRQSIEAARDAEREMRLHSREIERAAELATRLDVDRMRLDADRMKLDLERNLKFDTKFDFKFDAMELKHGIELGLNPGGRDKLLNARPRPSWNEEDPADSLYRVAREALNRGEWRRAAQLFNDVAKKFPRSTYVAYSTYWEAFCRYRSGASEDLRAALKILDDGRNQFVGMRGNDEMDVQALRTRVLAALAARGDEKAAEELRREANTSTGCDRDEMSVRAEALSALGQMDAATALPIVKKVLARRDECSTELRRRALYVAGRQQSPEVATIMLDVAKNDPDQSIRGEAMRWLPRVAGDNAVPQLEEILRTSTDEAQQRMAISALNSIDTERARRAVRAIIERNDAAERVRYEAIGNFLRERDGRQPTPEEQTYIRNMYNKLESAKLREAVLISVSRVETPENKQFLLAIVNNQNENSSLRTAALQRLGRMGLVTAAEIAKVYDVADTRSLREQILNALSQRKEDEAVLKMIEIGKKDTDPQIRRYAIMHLGRSTNPIAIQFMKDMWNQP